MGGVPERDQPRRDSGSTRLDEPPGAPPPRRALLWIALVAVALDLAVRSPGVGVGETLLVATASAGVLATSRSPGRQARLLLVAALAFGVWFLVRTSPWLLLPDLAVVLGLVALGVTLHRDRVLDVSFPGAANRALQALAHQVTAPAYVASAARALGPPSSRALRRRLRAVGRGVAIGLPLAVVLALLLASADAVFASLFDIGVDPASAMVHALLLAAGAWLMGGLLRASAEPGAPPLPRPPRLGWVEACAVMVLMDGLFLAFAAAQLVAVSQGGRKVIQTAGLTYAEYARSGFFQLLGVAAITLVTVLGLRAVVDLREARVRRRFVALAEATVALILVVVFVAVRRLGLYADAFGMTMLRLYCTVFAWWIGGVFVLLAALLAGVAHRRSWLPTAAVGVGMAVLLWLNVANPEAIVARHNVRFAAESGRFDPAYVAALSDDAIPALVGALPELSPVQREQVLARLCPRRSAPPGGWLSFNTGRDAALRALESVCPNTT
jgi:Domain of unknown function (DUF4173)